MCGKRAYCWKTMFKGRRFARTSVTSFPCRTMRPTSGTSKPAIMRSVVVFPHPLGPSSEKNSPSPISSETSSTALTAPKRLLTPTRPIAARRSSSIRVESLPALARPRARVDRQRRAHPGQSEDEHHGRVARQHDRARIGDLEAVDVRPEGAPASAAIRTKAARGQPHLPLVEELAERQSERRALRLDVDDPIGRVSVQRREHAV